MAIGRISGSVLKSNLTRNGVDLAFETNLLYLDVTNSRVGIGTSEPNTTLHVNGNTTITGDLSVSGNVSFEIGSINSLNTGALIVDDNNITGTRSNEDIVISAAGTGRIVLKNALVANTLQSDDSTAIQVNDGLNVSGTLSADVLDVNEIGSGDSTAIQVNDGLNVSGTVTSNALHTQTLTVTNINNDDSSTIRLAGSLDVSGFYYGDGRYLTGLAPALQNYQFAATASDISTYYVAKNLANYTAGALTSATVSVSTTPTLLASFATEIGFPNITVIPSGKIQILYETQKSSGPQGYYTYAEIYTRTTGGTETLRATTDQSSVLAVNTLVQQDVSYFVGTPINSFALTDRIVVKIYAVMISGTADITLRWDDNTAAGLLLPTLPASATNFVPYNNATADVNLGSYGLKASTITTNSIASDDSAAIQINDSVNVGGTVTATGLVVNGITYPATDGSANQVLTTNGSGQLSFTSLSAFTGITFVGDDSTGSTINTAETFKIVGTQNITTAVSGDTLTITGPDLTGYAQKTDTAITIVGDDSSGTAVTIGETFKIAGGSNITTAASGDTLTISIDSLNTGGLLIDDNKITGQRSNEDIEISTSGTGIITTNASIIPTTDDTVDLGSLTKRFRKGYFGSGTVYIGDQTISSSKTGLIFSGRINTPSSMLDDSAKIISKIGIDTSEKIIDSFSTSDIRSALYYQVYRDEVRNEVIASKASIVHDGLEAFLSVSAVVNATIGNTPHVGHNSLSATVVGDNVLYKVTGDSAINSIQFYRLPLFDNTGLRSAGRTSTLRYENLSTAETVIDTWSINEYRSGKYFVSVSDEGAQISNDYLNAEISIVHNGTDAYITTYNIVSSSGESFIIFTADINDGVARLIARSTSGTLNLKLHKLLLSDTESTDETDYQKIIGTTITSSAATTIDSFHITDTTAAFYTLSAHDTNNNQSSVSEVIVVHNNAEISVIVGPHLSTDGVNHIEWSTYTRGNQIFLQASGSESEIKITGYRIGLYRPEGGNSNSSLSAQGITFVGDDSTGTRIADNETVKITGGTGITTSMIGDTLTITATGEATAQGITFVSDDSTGTRISDGETIKIAGSGGITTAMSGDTLTITGPTAFTFSVAGDDSTQRSISAGNTIKFVGSNGITTATDAEGNVTISGTTLVTLNIDGGATATVYDLTGLNLDGGSASATYGAGETSVNGGGA